MLPASMPSKNRRHKLKVNTRNYKLVMLSDLGYGKAYVCKIMDLFVF